MSSSSSGSLTTSSTRSSSPTSSSATSWTTLSSSPSSPLDDPLFPLIAFGSPRPLPALPHPLRTGVVHHHFLHLLANSPTLRASPAVTHPYASSSSLRTLTYDQLDLYSSSLASHLRLHCGVVPGKRVVLLAKRGAELVVSILAVLKAGGQYVPLDGCTITDETLQYVLQDALAGHPDKADHGGVVICAEDFTTRLSRITDSANDERGKSYTVLPLTLSFILSLSSPPAPFPDLATPTSPAYAIYTSGTTGKPKGVSVLHRGITNVLLNSPGNLDVLPGTRVAHILSISFDMGAWEILVSLLNGGELMVRGDRRHEWVETLRQSEVVVSTPSVLAAHSSRVEELTAGRGEQAGKNRGKIRRVIVGGEVCPKALADAWSPHCVFTNCCGPTEISICNTIQDPAHTPGAVKASDIQPREETFVQNSTRKMPRPTYVGNKRDKIPIGRPIPNTSVYILEPISSLPPPSPSWASPDSDVDSLPLPQLVPFGGVGEMWVGGVGVSAGYLGAAMDPGFRGSGKGRERWRKDPFWSFNPSPSASLPADDDPWDGVPMMFNTGDLARWDLLPEDMEEVTRILATMQVLETKCEGLDADDVPRRREQLQARLDGLLRHATLEHLGRADDQVKVRGFRVELDGIATCIQGYPGHQAVNSAITGTVSSAVVLLMPTPPNPDGSPPKYSDELVAFVAPAATNTLSSLSMAHLREHVKLHQPYYAIPTRWIALEKFELGKNGKVDKKWLRTVAESETERAREACDQGQTETEYGVRSARFEFETGASRKSALRADFHAATRAGPLTESVVPGLTAESTLHQPRDPSEFTMQVFTPPHTPSPPTPLGSPKYASPFMYPVSKDAEGLLAAPCLSPDRRACSPTPPISRVLGYPFHLFQLYHPSFTQQTVDHNDEQLAMV